MTGGNYPKGRRVFESPIELLCPARFDLAAKLAYARWLGENRRSDWGTYVYDQHILAFNHAKEESSDGTQKIHLDDFRNRYHEILGDINRRGFDGEKGAVPVGKNGVPIDGAHRTAACIYYNKPLIAEISGDDNLYRADYRKFSRRGIDVDVLDFMAVEFAMLHPDCYMLIVWPAAEKHMAKIRTMAAEAADIVCEKKIKTANKYMALNIVQQVYSGEKFVMDKSGRPTGDGKTFLCFSGGDNAHVILLCAKQNAVFGLKESIRKLAGLGNHSAHTTDNKPETARLARLFFNANSLHNLTYARAFPSFVFWKRMLAYKEALPKDCENFCVHGGAVMEAYGVRESRDWDYVSAGETDLQLSGLGISAGNEKPKLAGMGIDAAVEDPRNYFYYHGVKFASIQAVIKMKQTRGEEKDRRDVLLIRKHLAGHFSFNAKALWRQRLFWFLHKIRMYRRQLKGWLGVKKYKRYNRVKPRN